MRRRPPGSGCGCALVLMGLLAALPFLAWAARLLLFHDPNDTRSITSPTSLTANDVSPANTRST